MSNAAPRALLAIPADLMRQIDRAVEEGRASDRESFVTAAVQRELATQERTALDAAFAGMASDVSYQDEALAISREFASADAEALRQSEQMA